MAVTSVQFAVATHIMALLGIEYGTPTSSAVLAASVNADPTFVRKSLSKLVKAGLVVATRGKSGSCALARPPEAITLEEVYRASEAPTTFAIHSYPAQLSCKVSSHIKDSVSVIQERTQRSLEETLAKITVAEVVADIRARTAQLQKGESE